MIRLLVTSFCLLLFTKNWPIQIKSQSVFVCMCVFRWQKNTKKRLWTAKWVKITEMLCFPDFHPASSIGGFLIMHYGSTFYVWNYKFVGFVCVLLCFCLFRGKKSLSIVTWCIKYDTNWNSYTENDIWIFVCLFVQRDQ